MIMKHTLIKYREIGFFLLIFIIYTLFGFDLAITNDACTNSLQIADYDILSRGSHFSFHFFGVIFYYVLNTLFGTSSVDSIEAMNATFSVLGSIGFFYIIKGRYKDERIAYLAVIIYAFSTGIFRFSCRAEYLVLIPSFSLISLGFYSAKKYFLSGMVFALGLLSSPFILLTAPAYLLFNEKNTIFSKKNIIFTAGFLLLYIGVSFFTFESTVSGQWSYSQVFYAYIEMFSSLKPLRILAIWVYGYLRSFNIILLFFAIGLIQIFKSDRRMFWVIILLIIAHLPAAIPEARYGGYQMPLYPFMAIAASFGIMEPLNKNKVLAYGFIIVFLIGTFYFVWSERHFNKQLDKTYELLNKNIEIPDSTIVFTYKAIRPIRIFHASRLIITSLKTDYRESVLLSTSISDYSKPSYDEIFNSSKDIYLIESGVMMPDDDIKSLFSSFVSEMGSKGKGFGLKKLKPYLAEREVLLMDNYPLPVYVLKKSNE